MEESSNDVTNKELLEAIDRLSERLDRLERSVEPLSTVQEQAPYAIATLTDALDDWARRAEERGVDVDERARQVARLAERLTEPQTLSLVDAILDRREQLRAAIDSLDTLPGFVAMAVDIFDDHVQSAAAYGFDVEEVVSRGAEALGKVSSLLQEPEFGALLDSGLFEPRSVGVLTRIGEALSDASRRDQHETGFWGAFSAMRNADIQRSITFFFQFTRRFGQLLERGRLRQLPAHPAAEEPLPEAAE